MNIITGNKDDLKLLIEGAYQRLRASKDNTEKYVLTDYITQLHDLESALTGKKCFFDENRAGLSNSQQRKYMKYMDSLFSRLEEEFVKFKDVYNDHFGLMLTINDSNLDEFCNDVYATEYTEMSKEEFSEYFYEFLHEYGLEEYFDKLITGRKIFGRELTDEHRNPANVIHDPLKKRSLVVMSGFEYNVPYLLNLGHELGHVVDLSKFNKKDLDSYMKYSYSSIYGESISTLFEKLFYDFLFRKRYRIDEVKEIYSEFLFENKRYVLDGYILSLLSDDKIRKASMSGLSLDDVLVDVEPYFDRVDELEYHLDGRIIGPWTTSLYSFGDYFSTVLKDSVQNEGFDSKLMRNFMSLRTGEFKPELLKDSGFSMDDYQKVYKREVSRLKK